MRPRVLIELSLFSVRDPSAVRVLPVKTEDPRSGRHQGDAAQRHMSLIFRTDRLADAAPGKPDHAAGTSPGGEAAPAGGESSGFIVTIGLRTDREAEFHQRAILDNRDLPYALLCERIMELREEFSN